MLKMWIEQCHEYLNLITNNPFNAMDNQSDKTWIDYNPEISSGLFKLIKPSSGYKINYLLGKNEKITIFFNSSEI